MDKKRGCNNDCHIAIVCIFTNSYSMFSNPLLGNVFIAFFRMTFFEKH